MNTKPRDLPLAYIRFCTAEQFVLAAKHLSTPALIHEDIEVPRLHLLCHGMEVTFKTALLMGGCSDTKLKNKYGHNLSKLWHAKRNSDLRILVELLAPEVIQKARTEERWESIEIDEPLREFENGVDALSRQHGHLSNYAFRYPTGPQIAAWRPYFLIDVMLEVLRWYLRSELDERMTGYPDIPPFGYELRRSLSDERNVQDAAKIE